MVVRFDSCCCFSFPKKHFLPKKTGFKFLPIEDSYHASKTFILKKNLVVKKKEIKNGFRRCKNSPRHGKADVSLCRLSGRQANWWVKFRLILFPPVLDIERVGCIHEDNWAIKTKYILTFQALLWHLLSTFFSPAFSVWAPRRPWLARLRSPPSSR